MNLRVVCSKDEAYLWKCTYPGTSGLPTTSCPGTLDLGSCPLLKTFSPRTSPFTQAPKIKDLRAPRSPISPGPNILSRDPLYFLILEYSLPTKDLRLGISTHLFGALCLRETTLGQLSDGPLTHSTRTQSHNDIYIPELFSKVLRHGWGSLHPPHWSWSMSKDKSNQAPSL